MKKAALFPALLVVCSIVSAVVFRSLFTYVNLILAAALLCITLFSQKKEVANRIKYSALWLIILELAAFVLLLFGMNIYQPSFVWLIYVVFVAMEVFVTPRIDKNR